MSIQFRKNSPNLLEMFWNVLQDTLTCGYYLKFPLRIGFENIDVKMETLKFPEIPTKLCDFFFKNKYRCWQYFIILQWNLKSCENLNKSPTFCEIMLKATANIELGAKAWQSCRAWKMLQDEPSVAIIGFDAAVQSRKRTLQSLVYR